VTDTVWEFWRRKAGKRTLLRLKPSRICGIQRTLLVLHRADCNLRDTAAPCDCLVGDWHCLGATGKAQRQAVSLDIS
jgi:hypothetical protein